MPAAGSAARPCAWTRRLSTASICSVTLASSQRTKYQYTVCHGGKSKGQLPPGASGTHHVEDRVDDVAAWVLFRPPARVRRREQRLDQRPLGVGQVGGVATLAWHPTILVIFVPYRRATRRPLSSEITTSQTPSYSRSHFFQSLARRSTTALIGLVHYGQCADVGHYRNE